MLVKLKIFIFHYMDGHPMNKDTAIHLVRNHPQKTVGAAPNSGQQGCYSLAQDSFKAFSCSRYKHSRGATASVQPQHSPERVVVLDTQSTVGFFSVVAPQVARVQCLTTRLEKGDFHLT